MTFGDAVSEQNIKVAFDPRLQISDEAINQKYNASKELEKYQEKIANIVKQLVESKNTATSLKSKFTKEDKKKHKEAIKASKEIIKKIDTLIAMYLGKIDKRQGITRNPEITVNNRFGTARWYVGSRFGKQTNTEKQLVTQFKTSFNESVNKVNTFFLKDWANYKTKVEKINISPLKKTTNF